MRRRISVEQYPLGIKMEAERGDVIVAKKKHPCGSSDWLVLKIGAEIRLKCRGCGRIVLLSPDEVKRMCKKIVKNGESGLE